MKSISQLFEHTEKLPTIPEVVREVIQSFNDYGVDTKKVANKIAVDQVLSARVLRAANSVRFGLSRQVGSLNEAMVVLGFNAVRTLVVASGLTGAIKAPAGFDLKPFWKRCAANAGYAAWLAKSLKLREDLAYTGGLMLYIGVLLIHQELPEEALAIERAVTSGGNRAGVEESLLGFTHAEVAAELASRWNFPAEITEAFKVYPKPLECGDFLPLAGVFHVADILSSQQLAGAEVESLKDALPRDLLTKLGLDADTLLTELPAIQDISAGLDDLLG